MKPTTTRREVMPVLIFCCGVFVIGFVLALFWGNSVQARSTAIEWELACFVSGNLIGFLFAIPKNNQANNLPSTNNTNNGTSGANAANNGADTAADARRYNPLVNNNLVEISDWLTKIIVGLGLVKLTKIPPYMTALATALASGLSANNKVSGALLSFSYALIVCDFIIGFLFAYLMMRLYLGGQIIKADQDIYSGMVQKLNAVGAKVDTLDSNQTVLAQRVIQNTAPNAPADDQQQAFDQLREMTSEYDNVRIADWGQRVQMKEQLAAKMAVFAIDNHISKDDILNLYAQNASEGLIITLATIIIDSPEPTDVDRLLKYSDKVTYKHVQYRMLNAIGKLLERKLVTPTQLSRLNAFVDNCKATADASLMKKIDEISVLLSSYKV